MGLWEIASSKDAWKSAIRTSSLLVLKEKGTLNHPEQQIEKLKNKHSKIDINYVQA